MVGNGINLFKNKVVQVLKQPELTDDWRTQVVISDGSNWVQVEVDKFYQAFMQYHIAVLDIIKIEKCDGSVADGSMCLVLFFC